MRPLVIRRAEPSEYSVTFEDPGTFSAMVFPVSRFVTEIRTEPVANKVVVPSEALSSLKYSLATGTASRTSNAQNPVRVTLPSGTGCHLGPRARAGAAVTTPPSRPNSAPRLQFGLQFTTI